MSGHGHGMLRSTDPRVTASWLALAGSLLLPLPWLYLRFSGFEGEPVLVAALSGTAILSAAFILSWASEVAQLDISASLAIAVLALIAILPEYAVDAYFAWQAARDAAYSGFALANMTGSNRLLVGAGWSLMVGLAFWRTGQPSVRLGPARRLEIGVLLAATLYALTLPPRDHVTLFDTLVFVSLFVAYLIISSRAESTAPHLIGPAAAIGGLPVALRRAVTIGLFIFAAGAILASAESFSEALIDTGQHYGVDEFFLVQWVAPLASEAPEFLIAILFAVRRQAATGLQILVASKINQWTLLVGLLPAVASISAGGPFGLAIDERQRVELWLTAAQSLFAVVLLVRLRLSAWDAGLLALLFFAQFAIPGGGHEILSVVYLVLAALVLIVDRERRFGLWVLLKHFQYLRHTGRAGPD